MISPLEAYGVATTLFAIGAAGVLLKRSGLAAVQSAGIMAGGAVVAVVAAARGFDLARGAALGLIALLVIVLQGAVAARPLRSAPPTAPDRTTDA